MDDLRTRLTDTAAGTWGEEAAVWLLAEHGHWLPELERCGMICEMLGDPDRRAIIDWHRCNGSSDLVGTLSERQVLKIARALAAGVPAWLTDLSALDEPNRRLVLTAVAWASGGSDWAWSLRLVPSVVRLRGRARDNH